jgi:hypothetical protein
MGASISLDSKYRMILETEVECISVNSSSTATGGGGGGKGGKRDKRDKREKRESDSDHSESDSEHSGDGGDDSESDASSSGSESDGDKTYTVKLTPEIINYIRSYIRKNQFLDEFDLITEIELDKYNHAPGTAVVFNSDSIVFAPNNQSLESVGTWEYIEPEIPAASSATKSKSKNGGGGRGRDSGSRRDRGLHNDDDDNDDEDEQSTRYKTKDDDLPVSEIESILMDKFNEYNKTREFVIHESKNSFLVLLIKSVELVRA